MSEPAPPAAPTPPASTLPPRPPTPGVGPQKLTQRIAGSPYFKRASNLWAWRRSILLGTGLSYALVSYQVKRVQARRRDAIHDKTILYWKIYDGGIVEAKSTGSSLNYLLNSTGSGSPDEPTRVMTLFEVVRTLKFIEADDRVHGIIADFSSTSVPSVPSYSLGLAQLEEIQDALVSLRKSKKASMGDKWKSVAWTDSFTSQGQFLFATAFDEVYSQPTGNVPLVGMGSTIPFYGRLAKWLGIEVVAEARNEYKSFVQPYIAEHLSVPQKANQMELVNDLNDGLMMYIARNRGWTGLAGLEKVKALSQVGPYTAVQASKVGLLDGTKYRQDVLDSVMDAEAGGDEERKLKGFYHYHKVVEKSVKDVLEVGVVYLLGTIGESGEFGTAAVVKGLKEAGEDDSIGAVVLRIDSGGGGVVESDTIWAAVRDLRKNGKTVVASFGNASASGGYLVSTHVDAIVAGVSTVTGSIGVAALRPTLLTSFFDRLHLTLDSFYTGSRASDATHQLTPEERKRTSLQIDEAYDDFKNRVVTGRGIHPELIDLIAGGRVMTGLKAFGLTASKELVASIRGLEVVDETTQKITEVEEVAVGGATIELRASEERADVAHISDDQATSAYAPPEPIPSHAIPSELPAVAESNAMDALAATPAKVLVPALSIVKEDDPMVNGPFGRGLVDGIGGIADAASFAAGLFLSNGVAAYKVDYPTLTEEQAVKILVPKAKLERGPDGELIMQMDVRLKRFPIQKSFLAQLAEANRRGDGIEASNLMHYFKASAATWLMSLAAGMVASELEDLGLGDARRGLGIGHAGRKNWMRAEWAGLNLR